MTDHKELMEKLRKDQEAKDKLRNESNQVETKNEPVKTVVAGKNPLETDKDDKASSILTSAEVKHDVAVEDTQKQSEAKLQSEKLNEPDFEVRKKMELAASQPKDNTPDHIKKERAAKHDRAVKKAEILKEYGNNESDIPLNHLYWTL